MVPGSLHALQRKVVWREIWKLMPTPVSAKIPCRPYTDKLALPWSRSYCLQVVQQELICQDLILGMHCLYTEHPATYFSSTSSSTSNDNTY